MPDAAHFSIFLSAAILLAITPGPGLFYVLARSLAGGRREGSLSSLGTFVGGLLHVVAAALGLSAVLATSALAFSAGKYAGAAYLVYLGVRMIRTRNVSMNDGNDKPAAGTSFRQGIWTEVLNPKTALFFLAFVPQFVSPANGHAFLQLIFLVGLSVALNTMADLIVVTFAGAISEKMKRNPGLQKNQRLASGFGMMVLACTLDVPGRRAIETEFST
jgi:threonine/homoserine/homoserine lactone efflux protein